MLVDRTLYVSDMDGTLLGADSRVSARSVEIINELIDNAGLMFTVATSRSAATVVPLMADVHCRLPFITLSGAALWNPLTSRLEQVEEISPDRVDAVMRVMQRNGISPFVYRNHDNTMIYTHHFGELTAAEQKFVEQRSNLPLKRFFLGDAASSHSHDAAMLIFAMSTTGNLQKACHEIKAATDCNTIFYHDAVNPQWELLEVYRAGCSKASAVKRLAAALGAERIVAFGDNLNDLEMMSIAHHAVAVSNALDPVKAAAHEIIGPNTADSVAHWLQSSLESRMGNVKRR